MEEVVRQLAVRHVGAPLVELDERLADLGVQRHAALRGQLLVERLADQRVAEAIPAGCAGELLDDAGIRRLVEVSEQACAVANLVAPEHLELMVDHAQDLVASIRNAGAVFIDAPTALGDHTMAS